MSDKGFISWVYEEVSKLNNLKTQFLNEQNSSIGTWSKKVHNGK